METEELEIPTATAEIKTCTIKLLKKDQWIPAADMAVKINPANAPALNQLRMAAPGVVIEPDHLALLTTKYWGVNGVHLTVGFMDNPPANLRARILSHMNAWGQFSNVQFVESASNPQVRIARLAGDGYWSYLGTDVLSIPANEPTMNLEGFSMNTPDSEFFRVVRHETGHTLGFPHEHLRAEIVNAIDKPKAITYFMQTQGWTQAQVIQQVLTPLDQSALLATANADPNSIMCYWLPAQIMKNGVAVPGGSDIDAQDAQFAGLVYPSHMWRWADQGKPVNKTITAGIGTITMMDTTVSQQRPYAFVLTSDGHVWVNWWSGSAWQWADQGTPPGKTVQSGVGVITMKDTPGSQQRPYVFVIASDGHLWVNWWTGTAWQWADQGKPAGKTIGVKIGAITMMDNPTAVQRPYVFIQTTDGHLWVNWWDGAAWHWSDQGTPPGRTVIGSMGVITMKDTPASAQRPYAFVQASDNHLWVNWWNGTAWGWADQGTPAGKVITGSMGAITMMDAPGAVQRPYVFVKTNDNHLWVNWWSGSAWAWADQGVTPGKTIHSKLGAITMMDTPASVQRPYVFARTTDGMMFVNWWTGSAWAWANQGNPPMKTITAEVGAITMMDTPASTQRPYVFVLANDGHLWVNWWS